MNYPRELRVVLLLHSLGASIDGVHIGRALGWDVEICGVLCVEARHATVNMLFLIYGRLDG